MGLRSAYLFTYNSVQLLLWSACLFSLNLSLLQFGDACEAYRGAAGWARRGQFLAVAEVLHALAGLAGGGVVAAILQSAGRSAVLFAVLGYVSRPPCAVCAALVGAWAAADAVRYAFYLAGAAGRAHGWLLWARYSLFLVLYPVGMAAECIIYYSTLREVDGLELHAVRLPNAWNFAFDFGKWNRGVLVGYGFLAPYMYGYMLRQRRRKLGKKEDGAERVGT